MMLLRSAVPDRDPFVLSLWYGLDGEGLPMAQVIGEELHVTAAQVRATRRALVGYLRGPEGRAALEKTVLEAANEIGQS